MSKHLAQLKAFLDDASLTAPDRSAASAHRAASPRPEDTIMTEIRVPTLGESVTEATIGKWFKKPGDAVTADEPLVELETDKVTLEVPAPAAGVLSEIAAKDGETVASAPCSARSAPGARRRCAQAARPPASRGTGARRRRRRPRRPRRRRAGQGRGGRRAAGAVGAPPRRENRRRPRQRRRHRQGRPRHQGRHARRDRARRREPGAGRRAGRPGRRSARRRPPTMRPARSACG